MSEQVYTNNTHEGGGRGVTGAVILIGIGIALLLNQLEILDISLWSVLSYWPVLLILGGLDMIIGRRSLLGNIIMAAVTLLAVLVVLVMAGQQTASTPDAFIFNWADGPTITEQFSGQRGDISALKVTLNIGAGDVDVEALGDDTRQLYAGEYSTGENNAANVSYSEANDTGTLVIDADDRPGSDGFVGDLDLNLTRDLPVDLTINAGAGSIELDLEDMDLSGLTFSGGAGSIDISLPESGDFEAQMTFGTASVDLYIPESLAVEISLDGFVVPDDMPDRYERIRDGLWQTAGFEQADEQVTISISGGVGALDINE
ncbi:MAG: hypothetical protein GYB64_08770 [Chloroflexi bacterium]|nr:hypothetical protein [Chloroflexota bacterium]